MANRQQRRKYKTKKDDYNEESTKNIIIILSVVAVIFLLFYLMTVLINNKNRGLNTVEAEEEETVIQYEKIIGDNTFTMSEDDYYVIFYDLEGSNAVYYNYLVSSFEDKIYTVDLGDGFNTKFIGEEVNTKAKKAGDLKVVDGTLIHIKKGKNVKVVFGTEEIEKILKAEN